MNNQIKLDLAAYERKRIRLKALEILGGKCIRCGFSDPRALQFDHIKGDGHTHREKVKSALVRYQRIISGQDRHIYQVLCANCNWIKRDQNGENKERKNVELRLKKPRQGFFKDHTKYEQTLKVSKRRAKNEARQFRLNKNRAQRSLTKFLLDNPKELLSKLPEDLQQQLQKYYKL